MFGSNFVVIGFMARNWKRYTAARHLTFRPPGLVIHSNLNRGKSALGCFTVLQQETIGKESMIFSYK